MQVQTEQPRRVLIVRDHGRLYSRFYQVRELGDEDAKITYFTKGIEQRMKATGAGESNAFIHQIASLFKTDASDLNDL
jgi:hypothetical protein